MNYLHGISSNIMYILFNIVMGNSYHGNVNISEREIENKHTMRNDIQFCIFYCVFASSCCFK